MTTVNIHQAKTNLSRLLAQVEGGKEVIIARNGTPVARLGKLPSAEGLVLDISGAIQTNHTSTGTAFAASGMRDRFAAGPPGVAAQAAFCRMVTNSSAEVGWMPMVASNCALVA